MLFIVYRIKFEPPEIEFYQDDKEVPIYSRLTSGYPVGDIVSILLKPNLDKQKVCTVQPLCLTESASFVIDVDVINFEDLKADDLGSWNATGTRKSYFCLTLWNSSEYLLNALLQVNQTTVP